MDAIKAGLTKLCPCCEVELEEDFVPEEEIVEEEAEVKRLSEMYSGK